MKKLLFCVALFSIIFMADGARVPGVEYPELLPEAQIMARPASRAQWLWFNTPGRDGRSSNEFYRTWLALEEAVKSAKVNVILEGGLLYINGKEVPRLPDTRPYRAVPVYSYDIAGFLQPGKNLIAVGRADGITFNNCRPMMMHGEIELVSGKKILLDSLPDIFKIGRNVKNWYAVDFDESKLAPAKSMGDVLSPPEYLTSFVVECMTTAEEYKKYQEAFAKSITLPAGLEAEPEANVKIVWNGSVPGIKTATGKILPPVLLIIHTTGTDTYDDQILRAYRAGVRLFQLSVKFDDLPYDPATKKYDYYCIDRYARRLLNLAPEAYIMLSVGFRAEWQKRILAEYPDEAVGYATNPQKFSNDDLDACYRLSLASDIRREKVAEALDDLGQYIRKQPWRKRICLVRTNSGVYTEWHWFGMYQDMPDTGKAMTRAFRAYLKRIYQTDSALQKAWHDPKVTLETALPPDKNERLSVKNYLRNSNSKERKLVDYARAMGYERDKTLISMCNAAKKSFPNTLIGAYYGYLVTAIYPPAPYDADMVLQDSDIDFFSRPYSYDAKTRLGGGSGLHAHIDSHAKRFGKFTFIEADIRTHLVFASKNWRCRSPEETRAVFARDLGNMITNGTGIQFYAVHDHFGYPAFPYSAKECIETIAAAIKIWEKAFAAGAKSQQSPIALIYDLKNRVNGFHTVRHNDVASTAWERDIYCSLAYAGRSFDIIDIKSFLQSKHHYNLVIFADTFTLSADERKALNKKLDRPDTAALWLYAPALNDTEKGFDEKNMLEATGIKLKLYPADRYYPLDMMVGATRFWNRNYNPARAWSEKIRVYADDPQAVISGRWIDDKRPAFVLKKLPNGGLSIFCGTSIIAPSRWMLIFDALGIPAIADGETYVHLSNRYINIPLAANQSTVVRLPEKCQIRDAWTNQILNAHGDTVKLSAGNQPVTWLLETDTALDYKVKLNPLPVVAAKLSGIREVSLNKPLTFYEKRDWQSSITIAHDGIMGSNASNRSVIGAVFAVDKKAKYRLYGEFRVTGVPGNKLAGFFFGFEPYSADNLPIAPEMIRPMNTGIFYLAKEVRAGDTQIVLKRSAWKINTAHLQVAFDAKSDLSDLPNRNLSPRLVKNSGKSNADGTFSVTLTAPMKFSRPAGTAVRLHSADAMHIYNAAKNAELTDQWQSFSGVVSGEAIRGAVHQQWWHGTVSAAPIFRYTGKVIPGGVIEFRNIKVEVCP